MNITIARSGLLLAALLAAAVLVTGCNSTPPRPTPPPQPPALPEPPAPPPPPASEHLSESAPEPAPRTAGAPATYLPPSDDAADVEIEEIPVDGSTTAAAPEAPAGGATRLPAETETQASGPRPAGGVPRPPPPPPGERDAAPSSGMVAMPAGPDGDLVGPRMQVGARTEREQLAALDDELNGKLAEFDERMRKARAEAEREKMEGGGGARSGMMGGRGGRLEANNDERGAGGAAPSGTGLGNTPDLSGETSGGRTQVAVTAPPPDIGNGRDDDIVARQLREAATKESDPVLREKLWEEYRKYKAGL